MKVSRLVSVVLLGIVALSSCSLHKTGAGGVPPVEIPQAYGREGGTEALPGRWWEAFGDDRLNALVDEVLGANLDLGQAWARLSQAEAVANQAASGLYPRLNLEAATTRSRVYVPSATSPESEPDYSRQHSLGLAASYEIDLWGRVRSLDRAARLDLAAVRLDLGTMAMSLSAEVSQTWFSLIEQSSQLRLVQEQVEASTTQLDLVKLRFSRGLSSALDVYQQRQQLAALSAQIPLIQARISILTHQLNVLLGRPPATDITAVPEELPKLWDRPDPGIPSELLERRPDVEAARVRVEAADHRVASALSDRFPRFTINASRGYGAESFADLFDRMIWSVTGGVVATLYDGQAKSAEVKRTRAVVEERLQAYGQTLLGAMQEVEDSLVQEQRQAEYVEKLGEQLELARFTLSEARMQYINGLSDYLTVLSAMNSLQQTQRELLSARYQLISYRIVLCRSLGGTWTTELSGENRTGEPS